MGVPAIEDERRKRPRLVRAVDSSDPTVLGKEEGEEREETKAGRLVEMWWSRMSPRRGWGGFRRL